MQRATSRELVHALVDTADQRLHSRSRSRAESQGLAQVEARLRYVWRLGYDHIAQSRSPRTAEVLLTEYPPEWPTLHGVAYVRTFLEWIHGHPKWDQAWQRAQTRIAQTLSRSASSPRRMSASSQQRQSASSRRRKASDSMSVVDPMPVVGSQDYRRIIENRSAQLMPAPRTTGSVRDSPITARVNHAMNITVFVLASALSGWVFSGPGIGSRLLGGLLHGMVLQPIFQFLGDRVLEQATDVLD